MAKFVTVPPKVNHEIVEQLRRMLDMAENGDLVSMVVTAEIQGNAIWTWADFKDGITMLGHLSRQMAMVNAAWDNDE